VKVRAIAFNAFGSFLRDRLLIVFGIIFAAVVLLMMMPLLAMKAARTASNMPQIESMAMETIAVIMSMVSGCGSLLAAWVAANSVASEMKNGTILAVMARPINRWQFLLGKFLGVMMLMSAYVVMMFALSFLLAWMSGQRIHSTVWVLLVYPLVRYAIYAALGIALVTLFHPVVAWGMTLIVAVLALVCSPGPPVANTTIRVLKRIGYIVLPSTSLLSESRFLTIREAALKQMSFLDHLTSLAYGADYALVLLLLAMWSFHYRTLKRD